MEERPSLTRDIDADLRSAWYALRWMMENATITAPEYSTLKETQRVLAVEMVFRGVTLSEGQTPEKVVPLGTDTPKGYGVVMRKL